MNFVKEFAKEGLRVALVAVIPLFLLALEAGEINLTAIAVAAAMAVLRALDRALHETGIAEKGLTRF